MKIGAYVGKFYPPHIGHLDAVEQSLKYCDKVLIVISKNDIRNKEIFEKSGFQILDAELIKSWFEAYYKKDDRVMIEIMDETNLAPYPKDQDEWAEKFIKLFPYVNVKIADESYRAFNEKYFANYEFLPLNRENIPIHSTMIRKDLTKYFDYLIPTAKDYFRSYLQT